MSSTLNNYAGGNAPSDTKSVVLVGVGGQGILLASTVLAHAAMESGYDVKTNEIHGMAQRGGSVLAQVRFGTKVYSPIVPKGGASIIASLEKIEIFRYRDYLDPMGWAIVSNQEIVPVTASSGQTPYPELGKADFAKFFPRLIYLNAVETAKELGNPKTVNSIVLGAVSQKLDFETQAWEKAFRSSVKPKFFDINMKAFFLGRQMN
ncbi:MAG: indolepyruvate oxidoreductase subunit beta [Thermoguttaceae bacterium]|nr:indolepyruvate oxidoreductase subunit beta [Thermoguttaceae bacterium]